MRLFVRILVCLGICAWLLVQTSQWQKAAESYEARFTPALDLPGAKKPYFFDNDCYYWLSYAERMVANGEWRIRYTNIDNVPFGREMHWSQSIAWLEVGFGKIRSLATGESWLEAIPRAAIWVNPVLFAISLCLLFCLLDGCLGFLPAALGTFWMVSLGDMGAAFHPYRPDHQSLHLLFSQAALLLLLTGGAGWVGDREWSGAIRWLVPLAPPTERQARRYFLASGMAGGLALWIGATVQIFCLGLIMTGVLSAAFLLIRRSGETPPRFAPGLYRLWGRALAGTSLLMYAVEYLPDHFSFRLEVNHPLYALALLASSELLARILGLCFERRFPTHREWGIWTLLAGMAVALPLAAWFGGPSVHALHDPVMLRLHELVNESRPLSEASKDSLPLILFSNYLVLPLFLPLALGLVFFGRLQAVERWTLWIGSVVPLAC